MTRVTSGVYFTHQSLSSLFLGNSLEYIDITLVTEQRCWPSKSSWSDVGTETEASQFQRWQRDWSRDQCVTVAQLHTGHSSLLAGYLHRIGRPDSATCPHCNGADETAEHLVLQCPAHDQARRDIWPGGKFNTDPQRLWDFLEWIGAVTRPPDREWERETEDGRRRIGRLKEDTARYAKRSVTWSGKMTMVTVHANWTRIVNWCYVWNWRN